MTSSASADARGAASTVRAVPGPRHSSGGTKRTDVKCHNGRGPVCVGRASETPEQQFEQRDFSEAPAHDGKARVPRPGAPASRGWTVVKESVQNSAASSIRPTRGSIGSRHEQIREVAMTACIVGWAHTPFGRLDGETRRKPDRAGRERGAGRRRHRPGRRRRDRARPLQRRLLGAGFHRLAGAAGLAGPALQARPAGRERLRHRLGGGASGPARRSRPSPPASCWWSASSR